MASVLPASWTVPDKIKARFGTQAGTQRAMFHDGHLVLVTHVPPGPNDVDRVAAIFWRNPEGAWKSSNEARGGLLGLRELVDTYKKRVLELEAMLDSAKRAAQYFDILQRVGPIARAARHLHAALQSAREEVPGDRDIIALRDAAADVERTGELIEKDARAGLDFTVASRAEAQAEQSEAIARASHRLNLIAALFLPISALGSVFGVNLVHGLENVGSPFLFWGFLVLAFVLGLIVRSTVASADKR